MPKLEKFIQEHRNEFDDQTPREGLWSRIEARLFGNSKEKYPGLWYSINFWRVAALFLLLTSVYFGINNFYKPTQKDLIGLQEELEQVESYYNGQLKEKAAMMSTMQGSWVDDDFSQDLLRLEAMYMVLKEEMKKRPSQQVKDAIVLNLIVRLDIINKQLEEAEQRKAARSI